MKKVRCTLAFLLAGRSGRCCVSCNKEIQEAIFSSTFYPNLLTMLSAFIVLAVIIAILSWVATARHRSNAASKGRTPVPLSTAGMVLGIGIGGFIDGILLHQLLQWHEMLTAKVGADTVVGKSVNMFWDGVFHLFTLLTTMLGIFLLWKLSRRRNVNRSGYLLAGGMLAGWGLFNLVEGIIDHQILVLHNVRELSANRDAWNYGFLALGLVQFVAGMALVRFGARRRSGGTPDPGNANG